MTAFKVGDRVRVNGTVSSHTFNNTPGRIIEHRGSRNVFEFAIDFGVKSGGFHRCAAANTGRWQLLEPTGFFVHRENLTKVIEDTFFTDGEE